ncbi:MAG: hypothetical protein FD180_3177 [Planctomycetota bacterium]|nr:MAG: hypothetical protein FD180_3177 [Planctomycetota bacterium]
MADAPQTTCCSAPDAATIKPCAACGAPVCKNCRAFVNGLILCSNCRGQVESAVAAEQPGALGLPFAIAGGVVAAIVSGAVWAAIAIYGNAEIGFIAIGVGFLAGWGVFLGAGKKRGVQLQVVAVACAVLGLLLGKYFIVANAIRDYIVQQGGAKAGEISLFHSGIMKIFFENIGSFLSPWDALWVFLALGAAWRVPQPSGLHVS